MSAATAAVSMDEAPLFTATLRPYRSLSPRGFAILMTAIAACAFAIGLTFWLAGAWPVVGFCGLEIVLIQAAFRLNYRAARASEEIRLTRRELSVRQTTARGSATETGFNPYWARIEVDRHPEFGVTGVRIASHGRRLDLGRFLGPREREQFAAALGSALARVRTQIAD